MMSNFVPQIPSWFQTRKVAQVAAFFALKNGGKINVLRLTKLIYLADRRHMRDFEFPITGDDFVSMPFGPVNSATYNYMNDKTRVRQNEWREFIGKREGKNVPLSRPTSIHDLDELSRAEINTLEETWKEFKDLEQFALAEWTHVHCPEWHDPSGSSIPIGFSSVYKYLGKENSAELAEQIEMERGLRAGLFSR